MAFVARKFVQIYLDGITRLLFTVFGDTMILLHGFIKKSQKLEKKDIDLAIKRRKDLT
jgi:phage-related protein